MACVARVLWFASFLALVGCAAEERASGIAGFGTAPPAKGPTTRPCTDGDEKTCRNYLVSADGVVDCFEGVRRCMDGTWGACGADTRAGAADRGVACVIDGQGISEELQGNTATVRLTREGGETRLSLATVDARLFEVPVVVSDSTGEFHVSTRPAAFGIYHRAELLQVTALRVDGRVNSNCDGFSAVAVVLSLGASGGGGSVVLTGATEDE